MPNTWVTVFVTSVLYNRPPSALQGMAFTLEERLQLGIHGLLPPCFLSQDVQVLRVMKSYEMRSDPLDKWEDRLIHNKRGAKETESITRKDRRAVGWDWVGNCGHF